MKKDRMDAALLKKIPEFDLVLNQKCLLDTSTSKKSSPGQEG